MAARGDIVQLTSMAGYDAGEAYAAYPYRFGYGYPDGYPFAYPYYAGIIGGLYGFVAFFARVTGTTRVFTAAYTAMAPDMPGAADTARAVDTLLVPDMDMAVGVATGNDAPLARVAVRG